MQLGPRFIKRFVVSASIKGKTSQLPKNSIIRQGIYGYRVSKTFARTQQAAELNEKNYIMAQALPDHFELLEKHYGRKWLNVDDKVVEASKDFYRHGWKRLMKPPEVYAAANEKQDAEELEIWKTTTKNYKRQTEEFQVV